MPVRAALRTLSPVSRLPVDPNVAFDSVTMKDAVQRIVRMAKRHDRARYVCTGNLDHLVIASRDEEFRNAYRDADLVVADGAPIVWLSKLRKPSLGTTLPERVAGSDLFWELARASSEHGLRLFFLGGVPGSADAAREAVLRRFPNATIAGTYCPPFETFATEEEQGNIRRAIRKAEPDVLLVAFGAPKQEKWIVANKDELRVPVSIGVGGSFEMAAGFLKRAPVWVQRAGLEWLYRFAQQPGRLFRRYFIDDLPYLGGAAARALIERVTPA